MEQHVGQGGENGGDKNGKPQPLPPQQFQQCPRCDSMNTKFCYYNNYSLAQPRFFCKTCKRYWTQGGTLRNIPIGGSPRKGRRTRNASSSQPQPQPRPQPSRQPQPRLLTQEVVQLPNQPNLTTFMRPTPPMVVQPPGPYYQGGGFGGGGGGYVPSLDAAPSMNPIPPPLDQSLNVMPSSNSGIQSGFNTAVPASLGSQPYYPGQIHPQGFYPEPGFNFPSDMANHRAPDTSLWNNAVNTTSSISGNTQNNTRGGGSSSFIPNHYPNLPGNGPHYQ